jgi:hypothetical protein
MESLLSEQTTDEISTFVITLNGRLEPFPEGEKKRQEKKEGTSIIGDSPVYTAATYYLL